MTALQRLLWRVMSAAVGEHVEDDRGCSPSCTDHAFCAGQRHASDGRCVVMVPGIRPDGAPMVHVRSVALTDEQRKYAASSRLAVRHGFMLGATRQVRGDLEAQKVFAPLRGSS